MPRQLAQQLQSFRQYTCLIGLRKEDYRTGRNWRSVYDFELHSWLMSERFTHSFKTALAVVLAYGLSLWFEWAKPMWAAFAVILISMPTLEASLGKGGERLWGTLLAMGVALTLIALFPQQRWWFMLAQAAWLAFCAYQMTSGRKAYLWFCAGFVTSIITSNGGPDPVSAFDIAMTRTLETSLGIVCFGLVFALLWPRRADVDTAAAEAPPLPAQVVRWNAATQVFLAYCTAFLLVIYVPGLPGGYGLLGMLAPFALILSTSPVLSPDKLVLPVALSILAATPVYLLLMPLLDGFGQLALIIFAYCFIVSWSLHKPEQALGRTLGLAFFAVVTGISNEQVYSFLALANTVMMFSLVMLILFFAGSLNVFRARDDVMLAQTSKSA